MTRFSQFVLREFVKNSENLWSLCLDVGLKAREILTYVELAEAELFVVGRPNVAVALPVQLFGIRNLEFDPEMLRQLFGVQITFENGHLKPHTKICCTFENLSIKNDKFSMRAATLGP